MNDYATCPNCGNGVQGVLITFSDEQSCQAIQSTLVTDNDPLYRRASSVSLWFHLRLLYDCLPYWNEFYDMSLWRAQWAVLQPDGTIEPLSPVSFQTLTESKSELFVEDVLRPGGLRMMMQPIVDIERCGVLGYEMLARGIARDGSIISPGQLYSSAREQNQLFRLDRACRMEAIRASRQLPDDALVFVNFVPTSIYVPEHCLSSTLAVIQKLGVEHRRIVFEVVETDRVRDLSHLRKILAYYRATGFRCALDDFGEGYSDEETMQALQPDIIKLDRKYVTNIHLDAEKEAIAKEIWHVGKSIGAKMLAEGVETEEEAITLASIGYGWQQGYWYGRPDWDIQVVDKQKVQRVRAHLSVNVL